MLIEKKDRPQERALYQHHSEKRGNLICISLKIGKWKYLFEETRRKMLIAGALNSWVNAMPLKNEHIKIAGYLISDSRVALVMHPESKFKNHLLLLFYKYTEMEIKKHFPEFNETITEEKKPERHKYLYERLAHTSDFLVLLITGRKVNLPYSNPHLEKLQNYITSNNFCSAIDYGGAKGPVEIEKLYKYQTPFKYHAGINYQLHHQHKTEHQVLKEMACISNHFSLIKTFNCEEEEHIKMNEGQQHVIDFVTRFKQRNLQLIMGTRNTALAKKHRHHSWEPGNMTEAAYTDRWVRILIEAFGGRKNVVKHLASICIGNEIDTYGPEVMDEQFDDYLLYWIPAALLGLKESLADHGLEEIPVTTTLKKYSIHEPRSYKVSWSATRFVSDNWPAKWNNGHSFIFLSHSTPDDGKSTHLKPVLKFYDDLNENLKQRPQVFAGQFGYSSEFGQHHQAKVIEELLHWLYDQYGNYDSKIPFFLFEAFDEEQNHKGHKQMGLFERTAHGNYKVKAGIEIPAWVKEPI